MVGNEDGRLRMEDGKPHFTSHFGNINEMAE
jgi:hypothetical protein